MTALHGRQERAAERLAHLRLAEAEIYPPSTQFLP